MKFETVFRYIFGWDIFCKVHVLILNWIVRLHFDDVSEAKVIVVMLGDYPGHGIGGSMFGGVAVSIGYVKEAVQGHAAVFLFFFDPFKYRDKAGTSPAVHSFAIKLCFVPFVEAFDFFYFCISLDKGKGALAE